MKTRKLAIEEYNKVGEQFVEEFGYCPYDEDWDPNRCRKIADMELCTKHLQEKLDVKRLERDRKEYWKEHKDEFEELKDRIEDCKKARLEENERVMGKITQELEKVLGPSWSIDVHEGGFQANYLDIMGERIFGCEIEGYFSMEFDFKSNQAPLDTQLTPMLKLNYPTSGSFDPFENPEKINYLKGLAELANAGKELDYIKHLFTEYSYWLDRSRKEITKLKDRMKNPFA